MTTPQPTSIMHDTIPLTTVILTKNEESQVARAIASLRFSRRVVVLDSGSTDGTRQIVDAAGAEFIAHPTDPPFRISEQRNWALDHLDIDTPWVLYLDADEVVPEALARRLAGVVTDPNPPFDAYELTPRYLFWGKWLRRTQGYPNWHPRLVKRRQARFTGGVWEHFVDDVRVGRLHEPYDHYANAKGLRDWLDRHYRYASWDADRVIAMIDLDDPKALGTGRKKTLRRLAARFWPLRPLARFLRMYVFRLGFLEGWTALSFCLLYFC